MKVGRTVELCVLAVVLLAALGLAFLWQGQKREAYLVKRFSLLASRFTLHEIRFAEQDKRLEKQNKKMAELEGIATEIGGIQAGLNRRKVDSKDYDMSLIQEMIAEQVKLDVRGAQLKAAGGDTLKVGVVSIRKIFQDCKRNAKYRDQVVAEQGRIAAELDRLSREIEAEKDGLKALREGSDDYLALMKEVLKKQGKLQVQREIYERQRALKERKVIEELYKDILRETREVAEQKMLDVVFERSEPDFPSPTANDLTMTISTHKLLYGDGCVDITGEVMARVDEQDAK